MVQQKDAEGNILTDSKGKQVLSEVHVVTNLSKFEIAKELRKHRTRTNEEKR